MRTTALAGLLLSILANQVLGGDAWLQFRGPDGQGRAVAKNLPVKWSDSENVVWKREIPGQGWSSPVIRDGRVYLSAAVPAEKEGDFSLRVLMLDAGKGVILKSVEVFLQSGADAPKIHRKNSHASPTPLLHGDRVYVHFGHQGTACLDLDLAIKWKKQLKYPPVHGNGGTPIVVGENLIFSCDAARDPFVVGLNIKSGEVAWKTPRVTDASRKFSFSTAQAIQVNGETQVISPGSNAVCSLDPKTGKEIWRVRYDGYSVIPRPVFGLGMVFVCTGYNSPSLMAIRTDGRGDVTGSHVAWSQKRGVPHTPSLLLLDDELYMVSDRGVISCLDAKTGEEHWQERLRGAFSASPVFADGRIYMQNEEGMGYVLRPGKTFDKIAQNPLNQRTLASYAVIDGALFIRSASHLYRIGAPSGE